MVRGQDVNRFCQGLSKMDFSQSFLPKSFCAENKGRGLCYVHEAADFIICLIWKILIQSRQILFSIIFTICDFFSFKVHYWGQ